MGCYVSGILLARPMVATLYIMVFSFSILQGARNEIFAMQPAPIQVSYMGFPGTMGASYIDYLVTDEVWKRSLSIPLHVDLNIVLIYFN